MRLATDQHRRVASSFGPGFSLVELLFTVAIVALLASLLLPSLSRSKMSARRIECLNNLRQMGVAASIYVDERSGFYPVAYFSTEIAGVTYSYAWDFTTIPGNPNRVIPGILWQSQGDRQIHQCPSFEGKANWLADPYTGYNYNTSYIGHGQYESVPEPARASAVQHPSKTILFGDGQYSSGANKFMRAPWPNPGDSSFSGRWAGTQGFRHIGRSNGVFCDGHAESLRDRYTANADGPNNVAKETGFLSPNNDRYNLE